MRHLFHTTLAATALATMAAAQFTTIVPAVIGAGEGIGTTAYPFGRGITSIRSQYIYDASNFASVTGPLTITRLRWRANGTTVLNNGGTYAGGAVIMLSTCPVDHTAASSTFASNHGADLATVHNGALTMLPTAGTTPNTWYVDVTLSTPFLYNPGNGDLTVDIGLDGLQFTGVTPTAVDCATTNSQTTRVTNLTSPGGNTAPTGTVQANVGITMEVTYVQNGLFAAFGANVTGGATPLTVQFADQSFSSDPGGVTGWAWDLDGDTIVDSTLQNPSFTYNNCGSYHVSLTVTDATHPANTNTRNNFIVTDAVVADFNYQVISPFIVHFTDLTTPAATAWAWDFDNDNVVDSTAQNPVHVYPSTAGLTTVRLTASRLCGAPSTVSRGIMPTLAIITALTGGTGLGGSGAGNCFDLTVHNPLGINLTSIVMCPYSTTTPIGTPLTLDVYVTDAPGGYAANHTNAAVWRLAATGTGQFGGGSLAAPVPTPMTLNRRLYIPPGTYGIALHINGTGICYTSAASTVGNSDVTLSAGNAKTVPFNATASSPRTWNGILFYDVCNIGGLAGQGFLGAGCAGAMGISRLTSAGLPVLGQTFTVDLNNLPANGAILVVGYSRTQSGFGPLPFDLTPFGLPGCSARVSTDITLALTGAGNAASLPVPIPNSTSLMCVQLYAQALVMDPAANSFGGVVSDAMAVILGN